MVHVPGDITLWITDDVLDNDNDIWLSHYAGFVINHGFILL